MIKFTFIFIILWWITHNRKNQKFVNQYIYICAGLFAIMFGLRNEAIFGDTYSYVQNFESLANMSYNDVIYRFPKDYTFWTVSNFLYPILFGNYTFWLSLISLAYIFPVTILVKRFSVNPMYSWLIFIFVGLMGFVMAGLRQTVAFAFTMTAVLFLIENKRKYFVACVLGASLFHGTALIFFVLYPLSKLRFNRKTILIYVITFIVLAFAGSSSLSFVIDYLGNTDERYASYSKLQGSNSTYLIQQALLVLPSLFLLRKRLNENNISLLAHSAVLGLLFVSLSPLVAEMFRVSMYFSWANMLLFPFAMEIAKKRSSFIPVIFVLFFILYLVFINKAGWQEYYFWFEDTTHIIKNFYI